MYACCEKPENREVIERRGTVTVERCVECNRRHHTIEADPVVVGMRMAGLDGSAPDAAP